MDPKHLALAHGEKALVVLVAAISGWTVYSAFTNPGIRPEGQGVTQQSIAAEIDAINNRMVTKDYPSLKAPKQYMQMMSDRFGVAIPRPQRYSWLFVHPDIDNSVSAGPYFYAYEIYQPKVTASDDIGKVILNLAAPDENLHPDDPADPGAPQVTIIPDRHSALWAFDKARPTENGDVVNSAHVLGVQVEMAVGQDGFHPLNIEGKIANGFVPLSDLSHGGAIYHFKSTATWQEVRFRTRTVVKATGFLGTDKNALETVLMHRGYWAEPKDWKDLDKEFLADAQAFMKPFMQPDDADAPVALAKGEHLYYSEWNEPQEARTIITAEVRFAFVHFEGDPATGIAHFLISRQYPGGKWLDKPQLYKLKIGDNVGDVRDGIHTPVDQPGLKRAVDLTTPFRLKEVKVGQSRTLFWGLRVITVPGEAGGRSHHEFKLDAITKPVDIAILQNTKTSDEVPYARLERIDRPDLHHYPAFYPILPKKHTEELDAFESNPAAYQELPMEAAKPLELNPGDAGGPLAKLHGSDAPCAGQATSNVSYYQFPDGRLVWINEENYNAHGIFQWQEPQIPDEAPATAKTGNKPAPPAPPTHHAPQTNPNGGTTNHGPSPNGPPGPVGPPPGVGPPGGFNGGGPGGQGGQGGQGGGPLGGQGGGAAGNPSGGQQQVPQGGGYGR